MERAILSKGRAVEGRRHFFGLRGSRQIVADTYESNVTLYVRREQVVKAQRADELMWEVELLTGKIWGSEEYRNSSAMSFSYPIQVFQIRIQSYRSPS